MIYNLLRNALLAWLLHAAASVVLDAGDDAPALVAAVPAQSCAMPVAVALPAPGLAPGPARSTMLVPVSPAAGGRDARTATTTIAGAHS